MNTPIRQIWRKRLRQLGLAGFLFFLLKGIAWLVVFAAVGRSCQAQAQSKPVRVPANVQQLLQKNGCLACHAPDKRLVGPAYVDVAKQKYTPERIIQLVHKPEPKNWPGYPPMTPMPHVPKEDIRKIVLWINSLHKPRN